MLRVIVRIELPPAVMVAGPKVLPSVTAVGEITVKVAIAGAGLFPLLVCSAPAAIELMKLPPLAAITGTVNTQEPTGITAPVPSVTVEPPTAAVSVPPQVLV